jgi:hypothetical protein
MLAHRVTLLEDGTGFSRPVSDTPWSALALLKGQHPFRMLSFEQFEFATTETTADPSAALPRISCRDPWL